MRTSFENHQLNFVLKRVDNTISLNMEGHPAYLNAPKKKRSPKSVSKSGRTTRCPKQELPWVPRGEEKEVQGEN